MEPPGPDTPFGWALARRRGDDAAVARLYALKAERGLSDDDPLWEFVDLHEGYLQQYESIAHLLAETVKAANRRLAWRQILVALGLVGMLVAAAGWWAYGDGWIQGYHEGYGTAQSEFVQRYDLSAAAWAMTSQGRQARELAREGLLGWTASQEAREMRRLGPEGFAKAALKDLEDQGLAMVARGDALWLASPLGRRARTLSEKGALDWLDSQAGGQARTASEDGSLAWLISEDGQKARALSEDSSLDWLSSSKGQLARAASQNGSLDWLQSEFGQSMRAIGEDPDFETLSHLADARLRQWLTLLIVLLDSGLLYDEDGPLLLPPACSGREVAGWGWRSTQDGNFCDVWFGQAFFRIR